MSLTLHSMYAYDPEIKMWQVSINGEVVAEVDTKGEAQAFICGVAWCEKQRAGGEKTRND
jgi:hypothetical protein